MMQRKNDLLEDLAVVPLLLLEKGMLVPVATLICTYWLIVINSYQQVLVIPALF
jgi:hypothetical protein